MTVGQLRTRYEEVFLGMVRSLVRQTGQRKIVFAGGCALNSVANGRMALCKCAMEFRLNGHYLGTRTVAIDEIKGSESRAEDFDTSFHPLNGRSMYRWVNVAVARKSGVAMPPVELIKVGDEYFVRDGHHRISVARAFGQLFIEAQVITWNAQPPYPWEKAAVARVPAPQPLRESEA